MARRPATIVAAALTASSVVAAFALTTGAAAAPPGAPVAAPPPVAAAPDVAAPGMLAAMQRDLGLTPAQAAVRLAREKQAASAEAALRTRLGSNFGGAWLTPDASAFVVAVTNAAQADLVRAAGAQPAVVARSERQLVAAKARLDRAAGKAPRGIGGWHVDLASNSVVVLAAPSARNAAEAYVARSGADPAAVKVVARAEQPRPLFDVRGGAPYFINNAFRCSIGFSVNGGFVTAGHCGGVGSTTAGFNRVAQGTVQGSSFPGNDYGWVRVNSNWTPRPWVNRDGANITVTGRQEAAVNASICRSGSTSGWHCGTILSKNATANYPQGAVFGLTRTNACAEGGDSGGSWLSGSQAQGVTSGGSGNCSSGGITFFQPLNEILGAFGLTLVTSGSPTPPPPPPPGPGPPPPPPPPGGGTWQPNTFYPIGAQVTYGGGAFRCIQAHTSLTGWEPPNVPALWQRL